MASGIVTLVINWLVKPFTMVRAALPDEDTADAAAAGLGSSIARCHDRLRQHWRTVRGSDNVWSL